MILSGAQTELKNIANHLTVHHAKQFETQCELSKKHTPVAHFSPGDSGLITHFTFEHENNGFNQHFVGEFGKGKAKMSVKIPKHKRHHKASLVVGQVKMREL